MQIEITVLSGSCANITLFISVKGQAGIPQIKKISGDPDSWTAVIKSTGNLDISTISGKPGVHLFGKLGAHPLASLLYCSNGQKQAIESINMKGSPAVRTRYSWTSLQVITDFPPKIGTCLNLVQIRL